MATTIQIYHHLKKLYWKRAGPWNALLIISARVLILWMLRYIFMLKRKLVISIFAMGIFHFFLPREELPH